MGMATIMAMMEIAFIDPIPLLFFSAGVGFFLEVTMNYSDFVWFKCFYLDGTTTRKIPTPR
jgi:hypothetical protein